MVNLGLNKRNQGWECPKCHATYAPRVSRCQRCYEAGEQKRMSINEIADKYFPNRDTDELTVSIGDLSIGEIQTSSTNFKFVATRPTIFMPRGDETTRGFAGEA